MNQPSRFHMGVHCPQEVLVLLVGYVQLQQRGNLFGVSDYRSSFSLTVGLVWKLGLFPGLVLPIERVFDS